MPGEHKIKQLANHYGKQAQTLKCIEEKAELTQALCKNTNIAEEIADVEIMLEQIKYLYFIDDEEVEKIKEYKINRQIDRIANNG